MIFLLQDESEVCITDAQSLDRLSLQSQEELEEVNIERYLQVLAVFIVNITIIVIVNIIVIVITPLWVGGANDFLPRRLHCPGN